jgi:hypothetical protein
LMGELMSVSEAEKEQITAFDQVAGFWNL